MLGEGAETQVSPSNEGGITGGREGVLFASLSTTATRPPPLCNHPGAALPALNSTHREGGREGGHHSPLIPSPGAPVLVVRVVVGGAPQDGSGEGAPCRSHKCDDEDLSTSVETL